MDDLNTVTSCEVVIIGSGPTGIFAVFELGLLDIKSHVFDVLDSPGGQCNELYPDKPIYDIPGLPVITAKELVDGLLQQCAPFKPVFHLGQLVTNITKLPSNDFLVTTDGGKEFKAKAVVIAAGGGSFQPRKLNIPEASQYENISLFYAVKSLASFDNQDILIVGGGDAALDWALELQKSANRVTLVHRRDAFRATPASVNKMHELVASGQMAFKLGQISALHGDDGNLTGATIKNEHGKISHSCTRIIVMIGLVIKREPIDTWGLEMEKNLITVDTATFQTNIPGIFAIGDINYYPGKLKLILSGFHEAALMAQAAYKFVFPDKKLIFQYTTSSSKLQKKLKVKQ